METMETKVQFRDDWEALISFLPEEWREKARETGAIRRTSRKFPDEEAILRTLMIHLAEGCSLRETAVRAQQGGIASVSDVAILKKLRVSGEWLRWMAEHFFSRSTTLPDEGNTFRMRVRMVDATTVCEPGSTGTDWRIHYSLQLKPLRCDFFEITDVHGGETYMRYPVHPGDLILGDRIYASTNGVSHVLEHGGHVLARMRLNSFRLRTPELRVFKLMTRLRKLNIGEVAQWPVVVLREKGKHIEGRVCAIRRSALAAELAKKKLLQKCTRQGRNPSEKRLEAVRYVFVFTTLPPDTLSAVDCLELYRARWQIELAFKRLKSIMGLGHLPKYDPESAKAWLYGKLLVALWSEEIVRSAHAFSPWGYEFSSEGK